MSAAIRPEREGEAEAVRAVHLAAFPTPLEADLVEQLRADGDTEISLVAEQGGWIVGHILMSRMHCEGSERRFRALGLAPVAVHPDQQRNGIGSALIQRALETAWNSGAELVFVLGKPDYYRRFGFTPEAAAPFVSPCAGPYLMARKRAGVALPSKGRADYAPAFAGLG